MFDTAAVAAGTIARVNVAFATLAEGTPSSFPLIVAAGAQPGPVLACTGGIHGDEYEGPAALWRLADMLDPARLRGRVLIVPIAHAAAFAAGTRTSPIDGLNLARIFPGDAHGTHSLRLAHVLFETVVAGADILIDCHSGGARLAFIPVAGFYGADQGIAQALAARSLALARCMGLPHIWRLPARAGVLSYEAMRRGVAATGGEIGGRGGLLRADADAYLHGILRILAAEGMIDDPGLPPLPHHASYLDGDWAVAQVGGFIENHVALGERVAAGALLAAIHNPLGDLLVSMHAEHDGLVMGVRHLRSIQAGEWATCVVAQVPLRAEEAA